MLRKGGGTMGYILAMLMLFVLPLSPTKAQDGDYSIEREISAANWIDACKEKPTTTKWRQGICVGQIQTLYMLAVLDDLGPSAKFCPPNGVTVRQTQAVVVKYIDDRPEQLHRPFLFLAIRWTS
jgi:hypothetical protein